MPTVTDGTFATPKLSTPSVGSTPITASYTNEGATGTTVNLLAKLTGAPSAVIVAATTDTSGIVGICASGCGTTGTAEITTIGQTSCQFDGSTTAGDYVQISSTTTGNCHDAGSSYPTAGQVLGRVLSTNVGAGAYGMALFGLGIKQNSGVPVVQSDQTGLTANTGPITLTTPSANGFYRFSCFVVETTNAGVSSTLPSCLVGFTDANSSSVLAIIAVNTNTANTVGSIGQVITGANGNAGFYAKSGVAITYSTSGYASNPGATMAYAVHVRLEGPF